MRRSALATLAATLVAAAMLPAGPAAAARQDTPELVSVEILTPQVDVSSGWGNATVAVHLRHSAGLPDTMRSVSDYSDMVTAYRGRGYPDASGIDWPVLERVSGTATDGVWRSTVRLSPAWTGSYPVTHVQVTDADSGTHHLPVTNGPTVTVRGGEVWSIVSVRTPIQVVTGDERWRPRSRVTNTVTGRPVGGARVRTGSVFDSLTSLAWLGTTPGTAADATGLWTSPVTYSVRERPAGENRNYGYGGRGSRGWSMQGIGCEDLTVKVQASATYSDTTLTDDQPLVVTGNVWPAPAIYPLGAQALLQRDLGAAGWQTLTTADVRHSGRYTLTWYPVQPGSYDLRVRVPGGGGAACTTGRVGTTLPTTTATVRWSGR